MSSFGEIVFPTSRAIWDLEDDEDFISNSTIWKWDGQSGVPVNVDDLLIIETKKLTGFARECLIKDAKAICSLRNANISIYQSGDRYVVLCDECKDISAGEATDALIPWLDRARSIIAVSSLSTYKYTSANNAEMPNTFVRSLKTGKIQSAHAPPLEMPNLITGIVAGVLTYCKFKELSGVLYACYLDSQPLDSASVEPIVDILRKHNVQIFKPYKMKVSYDTSNLYM